MKEYYEHLCGCDCGGRIEIQPYHKYYGIPKRINGHQTKNLKWSEESKKKLSNSKKGKKIRPMSDEHKKSISISNKGKNTGPRGPLAEETKRKMRGKRNSYKLKGPLTKKHKNNISKSLKGRIGGMLGKTQSEQSNLKRSESLKGRFIGNLNHQWKGGISCEPYCEVWIDQEFKQSIKKRDDNKCLNPECSGKSKRLVLHHINYNKKDCKPTNLITICNSCNSKANKDRDWHQSWYESIIYRRYIWTFSHKSN